MLHFMRFDNQVAVVSRARRFVSRTEANAQKTAERLMVSRAHAAKAYPVELPIMRRVKGRVADSRRLRSRGSVTNTL